jgi:hypothetical protein
MANGDIDVDEQELSAILRNQYGWRHYGFDGNHLISSNSQIVTTVQGAGRIEGLLPGLEEHEEAA